MIESVLIRDQTSSDQIEEDGRVSQNEVTIVTSTPFESPAVLTLIRRCRVCRSQNSINFPTLKSSTRSQSSTIVYLRLRRLLIKFPFNYDRNIFISSQVSMKFDYLFVCLSPLYSHETCLLRAITLSATQLCTYALY